MKKMLAILCVVGVSSVAAMATTTNGTTYTESWVNKKAAELTAPLAKKEKELQAKQAEAQKAQEQREKELAAKKAAAEKAQKEREAAAAAKKQQVDNDVKNLKNSLDAFKKYGK